MRRIAILATVALASSLACRYAAAQQFAEITRRHLPAEANVSTHSVALADIDGDVDLDLIGGTASGVRAYFNDGSGRFSSGALVYAEYIHDVAIGDLDADNDVDIVCATSGVVVVLRNDGHGSFSASLLGTSTGSLALGDADGDRDLDIVCSGTPIRLLRNDGHGSFAESPLAAHGSPVALGDVEGDGDLDLLAGSSSAPFHRLWRNDGSGQFTDATAAVPQHAATVRAVLLADVDGDGDLDIVWSKPGASRLHRNDGHGAFIDATDRLPTQDEHTRPLALRDVDRDGGIDVILGGDGTQNRLWRNAGRARFVDITTSALPADADMTVAVALGDVDRDGDVDAVFGNAYAGNTPPFVAHNRLVLNDGRGHFVDATASPLQGSPYTVTLGALSGDLDGDGDIDLLVEEYAAPTRLWLNDGRSSFRDATPTHLPPGLITSHTALADVDGDHDLDLVVGQPPQAVILINDGNGRFHAEPSRLPANTQPGNPALADIDGDGDLDLALGRLGGESLLLNDGRGTFADASTRLPMNAASSVLAFGDVDGDRDPDLVVGNSYAQNELWRNDGRGFFTDATAQRLPPDPTTQKSCNAVYVLDLDGDRRPDILWQNGTLGEWHWLYLSSGAGYFRDATVARLPATPGATRAIADFDEDGDPDLLVDLLDPTSRAALWLNDGTGRFVPHAETIDVPIRVAATGDLDGDGDIDVFAGTWVHTAHLPRALHDVVMSNLRRQVTAPWLPRPGYRYRIEVAATRGYGNQYRLAVPFIATEPASHFVPPLGVLGVDLSRTIVLPLLVLPPTTGTNAFELVVPPVNARRILVQAIVIPDLAWSLDQWRLSNTLADRLLR